MNQTGFAAPFFCRFGETMTSQIEFLQLALNASTSRIETRNGREHLVVSGIFGGGVMNRVLYTPAEWARALYALNGVPVTLGHPRDDDGTPVTANSPTVAHFGRIYNLFVQGEMLAGELWLDVNAMQADETGRVLLNNIRNGGMVEVSTGLYLDRIPQAGEHNGEAYEYIASNIRGDHLALLPNTQGACNVKKGCGVPRTNEEGTEEVNEPAWLELLLEKLKTVIRPQGENHMTDETPVTPEAVNATEPAAVTAVVNTDAQTAQLSELIANALAPLVARIDALETVQEVEVSTRHATLVANVAAASPLSAEFLETQTVEQLEQLATVYRVRNYAGAAGGAAPQVNHTVQLIGEKPMTVKEA